jgi:hypothetical protein
LIEIETMTAQGPHAVPAQRDRDDDDTRCALSAGGTETETTPPGTH